MVELIIGLLFLGLILIVIEFFVPGFGIFGISGMISIISAIIVTGFVPEMGMFWVGMEFVTLCVVIYIMYYIVKSTGKYKYFILKENLNEDKSILLDKDNLVNKEAITKTDLKPFGMIIIDDNQFEATSNSNFIEKGSKVIVKKISSNKIYVEKLNEKENL